MAGTAHVDIGSLVVSTPGVYGGRPCLAGTRFPVRLVAAHYRDGMTPEAIVDKYEGIELQGVYAAITYYLANREEVDNDLEADEAPGAGRAVASA